MKESTSGSALIYYMHVVIVCFDLIIQDFRDCPLVVARGRDNMLEALMSIDCIPAFEWLESISTSY